MIQPVKKSSELIDLINQMIDSGVNDAEELNRIESEAARLKQYGLYTEALEVQGMVAAFRGNIAELERKFEGAINASGGDPLVMLNYAKALSNVHLHRKARAYSVRALERAPDDLSILRGTLRVFADAFDLDGAEEVLHRLERLGAECLEGDRQVIESIVVKRGLLQETGATGNEVAARIELVAEVVRGRGYAPRVHVESMCGDNIFFEFAVEASEDELVSIEAAIHEAIAEQKYCKADSAIMFSCTSLQNST